MAYQAVATLCQVTVLPALLALAAALQLSRREMRFIVVALTCSGFFLVNAVYPWPKLYAAALLLTGLAVLVHVTNRGKADDVHAAIIGGLAALALLAHGGPMFSLLAAPILVAWSGVRRVARPSHVMCAACAAAILLGPWLAYQRYFDPPGTRLVKIHLAGQVLPDERPLSRTIPDAYRTVDPGEWLRGRVDNLRVQGFGDWRGDDPVAEIQTAEFFRHLPALGLLTVGLFGLAVQRGRRGPGLTTSALVGYAIATWVLWMVVMFRGGSAAIHHGSYATTLLFVVGGAAGTVAKTISAYDMAVSDAIYGQAPRYVSRQRLQAMLEYEFSQLLEGLGGTRGDTTTFFAFADTVATRSYKRVEDGRGWVGIRFQRRPGEAPTRTLLAFWRKATEVPGGEPRSFRRLRVVLPLTAG